MYNYISLVLLKVDKNGDPSVLADVRTKAVAMEHIEAISRQLYIRGKKVAALQGFWDVYRMVGTHYFHCL